MTKYKVPIALLLSGAVLLIALTFFALSLGAHKAQAALTNLPATPVATSTRINLTSTAQTIFATSTCVARTISTAGSNIMLTFSDRVGESPTAIAGFVQLASTTVIYDAGQFGCDAVKAFSFSTATSSIMETR